MSFNSYQWNACLCHNSFLVTDSLYQKRLSIDGRQLNLEVFDPCSLVRQFSLCFLLHPEPSALLISPLQGSEKVLIISETCPLMTRPFRVSEQHGALVKISTSYLFLPGRMWRADVSWRSRWIGRMALWWFTPSVSSCPSSMLRTSCSRSERAVERHVKGECVSELWPGPLWSPGLSLIWNLKNVHQKVKKK